jgi:VanZ family protein
MFRNRKAILWTAALVAGAVISVRFPVPRMPWIVQRIYWSEKAHVIAHMILFGVLAVLVAGRLWRRPPTWFSWRTAAVLALVLAAGMAQEAAQMLVRGLRSVRANEVFDLCVDLSGALLSLAVYYLWRRHYTDAPE